MINKKPSSSDKQNELNNGIIKPMSPYQKKKVFQIGNFSHKFEKESSNDHSFDLNYQLNMKKPIRAYDSPEFFKKVERQGNKITLNPNNNNLHKSKQFKIAQYNPINRITNGSNSQNLNQQKELPHSSYYPNSTTQKMPHNKANKVQSSP